ncbi:MAG: helicase [Myxococcales bacterium]|nr:helicase [Myxococcales bacterium]
MEELLKAIRESCSQDTWSKAVLLARHGAVSGESDDGEEVILRVARENTNLCYTVSLYPEFEDWSCECPSNDEACAHAAAAVIALNKARRRGEELPSSYKNEATISYRLSREPRGLGFLRMLVEEDSEAPFTRSLVGILSGQTAGPSIMATKADMAVDQVLNYRLQGGSSAPILLRSTEPELLRALEGCSDIRLDDKTMRTRGAPSVPEVVVEDHPDGVLVRLCDPTDVDEVFENGFVRCGDIIQPLGSGGLEPQEARELRAGRVMPTTRMAYLLNELLPRYRKTMTVQVQTTALPDTQTIPPRIAIAVETQGHALSVLPTLVYGDPAIARVDSTGLTPLQKGTIPVRNERMEERLTQRLQTELGLVPGRRAVFTDEAAVHFVAKLDTWPDSVEGTAHQNFRLFPELSADFAVEGRDFQLAFHTQGLDGEREIQAKADPTTVLNAWRQDAYLVPLIDGGWAPLPSDWLERFGGRVLDLMLARSEDGELPASATPDLLDLCEQLEYPAPPELRELKVLVDDFTGIPEADLPDDLTAELRGYQVKGVHWLRFLQKAGLGALLADDMGLGKTLQVLCALEGRTLVVAPTSVLHNWAQEIEKFRPGLRAKIYHGPRRKLDGDWDVLLTTYAILRLDAEVLAAESWGTVVLDEAQAIKNVSSQVTKAAYTLNARFRVAMTGTPVENRLEELWSIFHFVNRGLLGGYSDFKERYVDPIVQGDLPSIERLRKRIRPFVLRRLKRDVAKELPPRTDMVLHSELSSNERDAYDSIRAASRAEVMEQLEAGGSVMKALESLLRLRQAACHLNLVPGQSSATSSKMELLLEKLQDVVWEDHKALVFSQWTSLLDEVEPLLEKQGINYLRLDGSTRDRAGVVKSFQDSAGPPVLLISLKAGGTGLNLTAADHVFLLDPWWNPAVEDQAADRAHRIGQERPVMVYRMVSLETVEERILVLQEKKRALSDAALGGGTGGAGITRADLLELLAP